MCDFGPPAHPQALPAMDVPRMGDQGLRTLWVPLPALPLAAGDEFLSFCPQTGLLAEFGARLVGPEQRSDLPAATSQCSSPPQGPSTLNTTEKGKAGKIHLPREIFRSLSSQIVRVVVTVLNIQQLGMFKEVNQAGQVLDNTVVGITVGNTSISGLRDPVQLTFTHRQLPRDVTPQCVFWDPSKGQAGGWHSSGCVTQPGDQKTVCSCDHLTFFTLLLNPALDSPTAQALMAVATAGCGVAMAFSIFTIAFCLFIRCRFRFEETVRINLGLHMNLVGSLFLLNLAFLLSSGLSGRTQPGTCKVLGGLTHYCLLCCFTWTALEGCQLYLLFVKVLGVYIHHYLAKLCLLGWGLPVLVVGVAGAIGSYGEYSIQTTDHQVIALCVHHCPQGSGGPLAQGVVAQSCWECSSQGLHPSSLALCHASASLIVITTYPPPPPPPVMLSFLGHACSPPGHGGMSKVHLELPQDPSQLSNTRAVDMHHCPLASSWPWKTPPAQECPCIPETSLCGGSHECFWGLQDHWRHCGCLFSGAGSLPNMSCSTTSPTAATSASYSSSTWLSLGW
ncbi:adhesion G protein-coupled receptor G3 isoform X2 [Pseudopipra pipra]|uniref:adhesion G protein-coupled receptor G3 isoform X2 n=1 Tax=Pseudopipra pipra TaxID=415032 RepID=UPI0031393BE2